MKETFSFSLVVRPHETAFGDHAVPAAILNYLQDAAHLHADTGGFSVPGLMARGLTWVMTRYHLLIEEPPPLGEEVRVETWYPGRQKHFYLREFAISGADGRPLVRATTSWLVIDVATRRPFLAEDVLPGFTPLHRRAIEEDFPTLPVPGKVDFQRTFHVRPSDVDLNRHVNHVQYIEWALDSAPEEVREGGRPFSIEVGFRGEAVMGDAVSARSARQEDGTVLHQLVKEGEGKELTRLRTRWVKG